MNLYNMFIEYCGSTELNLDLLEISKYCYDREELEKEIGIHNSNVGGWQSKDISKDSAPFIRDLESKKSALTSSPR